MTLVRWTPRSNIMNDFDKIFNNLLDKDYSLQHSKPWNPSVDIEENETSFSLTADIPGMSKKDVSIELLDGVLTIKGERSELKQDEDDYFVIKERNSGSFCRSFKLPENVKEENIKASFKNGVLSMSIPKEEVVEPEARTIIIN
ncbi:MAG: Hsp20/alpha crystallin family protein [Candidatus Marinimicrobia bacterium]|jgi:HSP20 family protein|nr:Hsp20/alpha crystallin family protein [Candidatus Neomarinimicrobiota bacterium]MBT3937553.1 Hsp20/alpha crystallin family protein [Candidatus Neomarinimicrobiota bacterium]MBT3960740.1 Hsp20/alpha crystallin family protein [Candidatus Neomarinimicrobiota bacterium]MBT4382986.1 Hsp20/alpha crystallin family protein [Candidatus Neomarinimicrobiota bacterium]MBT4635130.1 Hsp20/alpha crystallin family protein [Candidatus Neomarinimicrobiota bacterium]